VHSNINFILAQTLSAISCEFEISGLTGNLSGSIHIKKSCAVFDVTNDVLTHAHSAYSACSGIDCYHTTFLACNKYTDIDYNRDLGSACVPIYADMSSRNLCNIIVGCIDYLAVFSSLLFLYDKTILVNNILCVFNFQLFCEIVDVIINEHFTDVSLFNDLFQPQFPQGIDYGAFSLSFDENTTVSVLPFYLMSTVMYPICGTWVLMLIGIYLWSLLLLYIVFMC
jgi:hypothetical protein